jgi:methionyl-tRNA formyltransferase
MPLRLTFMGTPDFAVPALHALHEAGHTIVAVYCQPPKPAGRGQHLQKTPVHRAAEELGIAVRTPKSLRDATAQVAFQALELDLAVVAAYGLILPQPILDAPRLGCVNIHASLLPRWRGAAPIQRALLAGDAETGITIMQMEAGLDTGPMLLQGNIPITVQTTARALHDDLSQLGARLIAEAVPKLATGQLLATAQPETGVTYAAKLTREDGKIEWQRPAHEIERQIRALTPWPGTYFQHGDESLKILQADLLTENRGLPAGTLLDDHFTIACGQGALRLRLVQRPNKAAMAGPDVLRGLRLPVGHRFT